jgi:hypothetical protein
LIKIRLLKDRHSPPARVARVRKTYSAGENIQKTVILRQERAR